MAALRLALGALVLALPSAAHSDPVDRWAGPIREASQRFAVPESWIRRVMRAESGGETFWQGWPIVSGAGAIGLMQLMPATWREVRAALGLGADPFDPRDNILAGAFYLRTMYDRFGYPGLFAAYNAGPARYAEYVATGRRLPVETLAYVAKIARTAIPSSKFGDGSRPAGRASMFAVGWRTPLRAGRSQAAAPAPPSIFVALSARSTGGDRFP